MQRKPWLPRAFTVPWVQRLVKRRNTSQSELVSPPTNFRHVSHVGIEDYQVFSSMSSAAARALDPSVSHPARPCTCSVKTTPSSEPAFSLSTFAPSRLSCYTTLTRAWLPSHRLVALPECRPRADADSYVRLSAATAGAAPTLRRSYVSSTCAIRLW